MDDLGLPAGAAWRRHARTGGTVALLFLLTLAGCLTQEPEPLFRPAPEGFAALAQDIAKFRNLSFKRAIALAPGFFENAFGNDSTGPLRLNYVEEAYKRIGLLPHDANLAAALAAFSRLEVLFSYDSAQAAVTIAPAAAKLGAPFKVSDPTLAREAPLGFAVVAALQEQNFHWQDKLRTAFLEDQRLALRALATGDAVVTLIARTVNRTDLTSADLALGERFAAELEKTAVRLPAFLREQIPFRYREGSRFVLWALKTRGWPGVDALYDKPPVSTAVLLHPEKYFVAGEQPLRFYPAALLRRAADGILVEQSLGEQLVRSLLAPSAEPRSVNEIAAQWRGDQLFAFQDDTETVTAWYSAWASPAHALTFLRAYRAVLERRQGIRFSSASEPSMPNALSGRMRDQRGAWLAAQGTVVLFLSGISPKRLRDRVQDAWRDLEIDVDSTAIRFDSVRLRKKPAYESLSKW